MRRLLARAARRLSSRRRRWDALLQTLTYDPLGDLEPLGPNDVMICGCPRSGTALATAALFAPPGCVSVMEPWDALRMAPSTLFRSLRGELATGVLRRGRLDVAALESDGRVAWCRDGELAIPMTVTPDTILAVKLPAFWRYLDRLPGTRFIACIRHPYEVIQSFRETGGRLGLGLDYDVPFNRQMNGDLLRATDDPVVRRALMYEHILSRMLPHLQRPEVFTLRYERWALDAAAVWVDLQDFLGVDLGPLRPRIQPTRNSPQLSDEERSAVAVHCQSARTLGYALD